MAQPYVGQILAVGFNFTPVGWLPCNGSLVSIAEYEVLYALIGTTYGGDGQSTFGLPDLRGRAPLCMGTGPGLPPQVLGQLAGSESVTLAANQAGAHTHPLQASANQATTNTPASTTVLGQGAQQAVQVYGPPPAGTTLAGPSIGTAGSSVPHENRQPFLAINYIISPFGVFPSQN